MIPLMSGWTPDIHLHRHMRGTKSASWGETSGSSVMSRSLCLCYCFISAVMLLLIFTHSTCRTACRACSPALWHFSRVSGSHSARCCSTQLSCCLECCMCSRYRSRQIINMYSESDYSIVIFYRAAAMWSETIDSLRQSGLLLVI